MERIPAAEVIEEAKRYRAIAMRYGVANPQAQVIIQRVMDAFAPLDEPRNVTFDADMFVAAAIGDACRAEREDNNTAGAFSGRRDPMAAQKVSCEECDYGPVSKYLFRKHMKSEHPESEGKGVVSSPRKASGNGTAEILRVEARKFRDKAIALEGAADLLDQ